MGATGGLESTMDAVFVPMLVASAVAMFVLGVCKVVVVLLDGEKRKLAERLSTDNRYDSAEASARAIRIQLEQANLPAALARLTFLHTLHRRLAQAYPDMTVVRFLSLAGSGAFFAFTMMLLLTGSPIPASLGGASAAYLPFFLLTAKRARRQKALASQLPEALDFLSRALKAGHSLSTGLQMMADELPQPMCTEFRQCYDQHSLGQSLDDALKDMATRIESTDFAFFVTAVLIQRQTGGDLSEVLKNISGMIRNRVRLQQQVKAKTAEGRFTGYIMVAFPIFMFFIASSLNPEYAQILLRTSVGLKMLGVAAFLQIMGLLAIRKITTVRV
jgi:tight adherence protein B